MDQERHARRHECAEQRRENRDERPQGADALLERPASRHAMDAGADHELPVRYCGTGRVIPRISQSGKPINASPIRMAKIRITVPGSPCPQENVTQRLTTDCKRSSRGTP